MTLTLNFLSVSPLLIVGLIVLVVVGIAVIALVLVHTHKVSKKTNQSTAAEQQEETAEAPVTEEIVKEAAEPVTQQVEEVGLEPVAEEIVKEAAEPVTQQVEEVGLEPAAEEVEEAAERPAPIPASAPVAEVVRDSHSDKINIRVSYNRSFAARIIQADDVLKNYYSDIKNELLSYKKVRSRMSWRCEKFRQGRKLLAKFAVRGKTLSVYFALDPKNYADTKYKIVDVSHIGSNSSVPTLYKVRNERRRRYAKQLIAELMTANGVAAGAKSEVDFAAQYAYETTEALLDKNLIKLVPWRGFASGTEVGVISVNEEEITREIEQAIVPEELELPSEQEEIEEVAEEIAEESATQEAVEEIVEAAQVRQEPVNEVKTEGVVRIRVRYNRSFTAKLIQADDTLKNYYEILKNELLRYKKVKSRISWRQETFRLGRKLLARMQIRGKTLSVYFALNPADYAGTKYKVKDVSDIARNAEVPTLYKIKNDRRCRYAKQLIADLMTANSVLAGEEQNADYVSQYPYEEIEPLIDRKLVKLVPWKEIAAGSEVGVITVNEEDITEEIALASEQPVEDGYVEPVEEENVEPVEDDYAEPVEEENVEPVEDDYAEPVEEENVEPVEDDYVEPVEDDYVEPVEDDYVEPVEEEYVEPVEDDYVEPVEDDYVEESVSNFFEEPEEEEQEEQEQSVTAEPEISINVAEADEILSDEYVEAFVHQSEKYSDKTKKAVVNIDTLGKYFNAGERVTVEEIRKRVPDIGGKVTYIKVLARGKLDKALTVEADDFSPQAIKMIVLTGGSVERKAKK